jgi:hypothetical protein
MPKSLCLLVFLAGVSLARADAPAVVFSHPDRIRYDGRCLTIDGRDTLILSGAFPYFRCPKALWRDRFQKIVASGCNAVETYVPWNWHERGMPSSLDDFSQVDLTDLRDWLRMAHDEFGLYTIIRPGPYICAEWDGGGFPRWLLTKMPPAARRRSGGILDVQSAAGADAVGSAAKPNAGAVGAPRPGSGQSSAGTAELWLRTDNPDFLAWSEHWLKAVCPVIAAEQVTRRPPGHGGVILFQIENEYDYYPGVSEGARATHLRALYQTAVAHGIEVPIFTCWTKQARGSSDPLLSQVFDAFNCYPRYKIDATAQRIHDVQAAQPDAPAMISELGGGWFSAVGGKLSEDQPGLTAEELNANTLLAIQEGGTILNYYVLFGGTNFGLWPGRGNTTTYDYFAPIREWGGVGDKYLAVKAIGLMLQQHGEALARSRMITCQAETGNADVTVAARRARNGDLYVFFRNHQVQESRRGTAAVWVQGSGQLRVDYALGPFGLKIFYLPASEQDPSRGEWLPKAVAGPPRPDHVPGPVRVASAQTRPDSGGSDWVEVAAGAMLPELGVDDARSVLYAATLDLTAAQVTAQAKLVLDPYPRDALVVAVNGHVVPCGLASEAQVGPWLHAGENAIEVLYDQIGQANIQKVIQDESGLRGAELVSGGATIPISGWKLARSLGGIAASWPALGAGLPPGWTETALDAQTEIARKGGLAGVPSGPADALATWYRVEFELPAAVPEVWVPWRALIDAAGDGEIFLNGQALGRYWEVGPQREYFLPENWLHFGAGEKNVLTLYLSPRQKGVRLRAVEVAPYADQAELR